MKKLFLCFRISCIALTAAFASPAYGNPETRPEASTDYLVNTSTSASGWTTVTITPLKVECERVLRSVTMDVYALGGTGRHRHDPARLTCDEREGHFSVQMDMARSGAVNNAVARYLSAVDVPARSGQTAQGPGDGHKDHQHVVYIFHDLE